ncbi:MAG TPA: hypothetical protein VKV80_10885 [Streptosporangiaceae bacterium]|nr:hypothetical protein [Streptosporangiaceae bacterium]
MTRPSDTLVTWVGQCPACRVSPVLGCRLNFLGERLVREALIAGQRYHDRVGILLREQLVILDHHRRP